MTTKSKIPPTITLAQLYEAQQQFFDAYLIYKKILENNPDEEIEERMIQAKKRIFIDSNLHYQEITNLIFNKEDKEYFQIIPDENYQNFVNAQNEGVDEPEFIAEDFEEDENDMSDAEELEEIYNPSNLPPFEDFTSDQNTEDTTLNFSQENPFQDPVPPQAKLKSLNSSMTVSDLSHFMLEALDPNKKITDLTLADIFKIVDSIKVKH